ncbi:MAG: hypothetical protein IT544_03785 [Rhodobacteraceae bacterium]|jgi:hypothetical protein|nr:hypothetical protein [Paracoccaceae bacterium]
MVEHEAPADISGLSRRTLDENLIAVLREEVEYEAAARRAEAASIKTKTEMPLAALSVAKAARVKGIDLDAPVPAPKRPRSRRQLPSDIQDIKLILPTESIDTAAGGGENPFTRSGFRRGFQLAFVTAAVGVLTYFLAQWLGKQIPTMKPFLDGYVAQIDRGFLWFDGAMRGATQSIQNVTESSNGG